MSTPQSEAPSAEVSETVQTPENVESSPFSKNDAWADFGKPEQIEEKVEEPESREIAEAGEVKAEAKTDAKTDAEPLAVSEEDALLEEIFSDSELDSLDPQEVIKEQGSRRKMAAARRNAELAEVVKEFQGADKPLSEIAARLEALAPDRYRELAETSAHSIVDANPEGTFRRAYVVEMKKADPNYDWQSETLPTLKDFIDFKNGAQTPTPAAQAVTAETAKAIAELDSLPFDWRDESNDENFHKEDVTMLKALRTLDAENKAKDAQSTAQAKENSELKDRLSKIETGLQTTEDTAFERETITSFETYRSDIEKTILPHIEKQTGLAISESDTPKIKAFKQNAMQLYTGTPHQKATNQFSTFEDYAYFESSVSDKLQTQIGIVKTANENLVKATRTKDQNAIDLYSKQLQSTRIPMMELMSAANKEFKAQRITPFLEALEEAGANLSTHINQAAQRVEVATGAASPSATAPKAEYKSASDVWDSMPTEYAQQTAVRGN